ncbi:MAG TPA: hypothetical protein VM577_05775 [Anaerovoracaceae bacterium]|nr:hypothetical protein [Anaerovoracaceae bacterium]
MADKKEKVEVTQTVAPALPVRRLFLNPKNVSGGATTTMKSLVEAYNKRGLPIAKFATDSKHNQLQISYGQKDEKGGLLPVQDPILGVKKFDIRQNDGSLADSIFSVGCDVLVDMQSDTQDIFLEITQGDVNNFLINFIPDMGVKWEIYILGQMIDLDKSFTERTAELNMFSEVALDVSIKFIHIFPRGLSGAKIPDNTFAEVKNKYDTQYLEHAQIIFGGVIEKNPLSPVAAKLTGGQHEVYKVVYRSVFNNKEATDFMAHQNIREKYDAKAIPQGNVFTTVYTWLNETDKVWSEILFNGN